MLVNLIVNASHAIPEDAKGLIKVKTWAEEEHACVQIADNGKGIANTEISSPTSLGLIGMRERVYGINGSIQFSGTQDKGTRVTVTVPLNGKTVSHA